MKWKLHGLLLPVLLGGVIGAGTTGVTVAFLTSGEQAVNKTSFTDNTAWIREPDFSKDTRTDFGITSYPKRIYVENTAAIPVYVRISLEFSDPQVKADSTLTNSTGTFCAEQLADHLPEDWIYGGNNELGPYYYFTKAVEPGRTTSDLITAVSTEFKQETGIRDYEIYVRAESIQTCHSKTEDGPAESMGYEEAWRTLRI